MANSLIQDIEQLYLLSKKWEIKKFEDLFEDISAGSVKLKTSSFSENGKYPIIDQGQDTISGYTDNEDFLIKAEPPFIIFGDHTRIFKYVDFKFAIGADGTKVLKTKNNIAIDYKYIYYFFKTLNIPNTGYNRHFKYLKSSSIPLPDLARQKAIAAKLDKAQEIIQYNKELIGAYEALTQSLFLDMFGDPVKNEKGWEVKRFDELGSLERGKSKHRPRNAPELLGGKYPLIQTGDVANCNGYITTYKSTYSDFGLAQSKMWSKGTLCITIAANIAKTGILMIDACFPDSIVGFTPNSKTNTIYIQTWISFLQKILEDSAPESAQKNINLDILRKLQVPTPPISLQNEFAERIKAIEKQKALAQAALAESENLFNALLQKSFGA